MSGLPQGAAADPLRDCRTGLYTAGQGTPIRHCLRAALEMWTPQHLCPTLPAGQAHAVSLLQMQAGCQFSGTVLIPWGDMGIGSFCYREVNLLAQGIQWIRFKSKYSCPPQDLSTRTSHYLLTLEVDPGSSQKCITDHSPSTLVLFLSIPGFIPFLFFF